MSVLVQVAELRFVTPEGQVVLEDVHLHVDHGEFVCLVGPPASGKSLLFKLLCREREPQRGQILVDDKNITRLRPHRLPALRRRLGIVPQHPKPLQRTVLDALVFKLRSLGLDADEAFEKAEQMLNLLGLSSVMEQLISELDAANQKLFFIALAASHDPVLLLIDEPFDGLDSQGAQRVLEGLQRLHERKRLALLVATRDRGLAARSGTRIVQLCDGKSQLTTPQLPLTGAAERTEL